MRINKNCTVRSHALKDLQLAGVEGQTDAWWMAVVLWQLLDQINEANTAVTLILPLLE